MYHSTYYPVVGKFRPNTFRPLHNPFSRPVGDPIYTNKKCAIEMATLFFWDRWKYRCKGLDYVLTVPMKNTLLLHQSRKPSLSECLFIFLLCHILINLIPFFHPPSDDSMFCFSVIPFINVSDEFRRYLLTPIEIC